VGKKSATSHLQTEIETGMERRKGGGERRREKGRGREGKGKERERERESERGRERERKREKERKSIRAVGNESDDSHLLLNLVLQFGV
jgi:hypothetical protein